MTIVLLSGEPGTLFPLALAIGAMLAVTVCVAGASAGCWMRAEIGGARDPSDS